MYATVKAVWKRLASGEKRRYQYLQVVESVRINGKPRHKVLASLGRLPDDPEQAVKIAQAVIRFYARGAEASEGPEVLEGRGYGHVAALRHIWKELGLDRLISSLARQRRYEFSLEEAVFAMVANRLTDVRSKLGCAEWLGKDVYLPTTQPLDADQLYETLGWLESAQDDLEQAIFQERYRDSEEQPVVVFYDTTTTWFEGAGPPSLSTFGRSRHGVPSGRRKILIALARTREGWPITHQVFEGRTNDTKTVRPLLERLRDVFGIRWCVWVTDRGMVSEEIIADLEALGYQYVLATKLRGNKEVSEEVLARPGRYGEVWPNLEAKQVMVEDRRYVVCRNPESVVRDRKRREDILECLRKEMDKGDRADSKHGMGLQTHRAYRRYLKQVDGRLLIDRDKVAADARFDGKWVLRSNLQEATAAELAVIYREQARIERDFRDIKSFIELRPIRHHKEEHVRGHVFVCVLAKLLERELRGRMHDAGYIGTSIEAVLEELGRIQTTKVLLEDGRCSWLRSRLTGKQEELLGYLGISPRNLPTTLPDYEPVVPRKTKLDNASEVAAEEEM